MIHVGAFQLRTFHDSIVLGQWWRQVLQPWLEAVLGKSSGCVGEGS